MLIAPADGILVSRIVNIRVFPKLPALSANYFIPFPLLNFDI